MSEERRRALADRVPALLSLVARYREGLMRLRQTNGGAGRPH